MSTFIDTETMRTKTVRTFLGNGKWSDPKAYYDMRGTPMGDRAEVFEWDRLVYPGRKQQGRRVREYIKVMHCPEGWWIQGGGPSDPGGPEICATLLEPQWVNEFGGLDRAKFHAFHTEHPVLWVVKVKRHTNIRTLRYCDPELPAEFRPQLALTSWTA